MKNKRIFVLLILIILLNIQYNLRKTHQNNKSHTELMLINKLNLTKIYVFDALTDYGNHESAIKLFKKVIKILNHNNISYWAHAGTLLAAVRDQYMLPWDDDSDLGLMNTDLEKLFKLKQQFKSNGIQLIKFLNYFIKLYDLNGKVFEKNFKFPMVDIFIHKKINNTIKLVDLENNTWEKLKYNTWKFNDLFPLKSCQFEDFYINIPSNPLDYLNAKYNDWKNTGVVRRHFKNRHENDNDTIKIFKLYDYNFKQENKTILWLINSKNSCNDIYNYNSKSFNIKELNEENISKYLPELLGNKLNDNLIKILILYKYGGLFIDCSKILVKSDLNEVNTQLRTYEFISFRSENNINKTSSSIMASRAKRILIENILKILLSKEIIEFDTLINNQLDYLIKNHNYKYFHYSYINHMLTYV